MVRIFWRDNRTGKTGNGSTYYDKGKAALVIIEKNAEPFDITYWYE